MSSLPSHKWLRKNDAVNMIECDRLPSHKWLRKTRLDISRVVVCLPSHRWLRKSGLNSIIIIISSIKNYIVLMYLFTKIYIIES